MNSPTQPQSLLARLLAEQPLGELKALQSRLRAEIDGDRSALAQKEGDLRELEDVIAARAGRPRVEVARVAPRNGAPVAGSLRQTILEIVAENAGPWTKDALYAELENRGVEIGGKKPRNTLGSRLLEMWHRGELKRVGDGYTRNDEEVPPT